MRENNGRMCLIQIGEMGKPCCERVTFELRGKGVSHTKKWAWVGVKSQREQHVEMS